MYVFTPTITLSPLSSFQIIQISTWDSTSFFLRHCGTSIVSSFLLVLVAWPTDWIKSHTLKSEILRYPPLPLSLCYRPLYLFSFLHRKAGVLTSLIPLFIFLKTHPLSNPSERDHYHNMKAAFAKLSVSSSTELNFQIQ